MRRSRRRSAWPDRRAIGRIDQYNVHRARAGVVLSLGNLVGQSTSTSFVDAALAPGTYFYKVASVAAGGPVSTGSNEASATIAGPPPSTGGAILVDKTVFSDGTGTRVTPAFSTTSAGELLLAFVGSDGPSPGSQTATVSGAGLAWTLVRRVNVQAGTAEIWKATASTILTNVTVTSTLAAGNVQQSLVVMTFTGALGTGATGAANAATGAPRRSPRRLPAPSSSASGTIGMARPLERSWPDKYSCIRSSPRPATRSGCSK